jgi:hypothetical protein
MDTQDDARFRITQHLRHLPDQYSRILSAQAIVETLALSDPDNPEYKLFAGILDILLDAESKQLVCKE